MNFLRSIVGESEQRSRAASVPQLSFSALRINESQDDVYDYQEFEEVTMEDVGKANLAQQRQEDETVPSHDQSEPDDERIREEDDDERNVRHAYEKGPPLDRGTWASFSDQDGRIVNELKLRKLIFRGEKWLKINCDVSERCVSRQMGFL